ncbi:MAG: hypothetical protein KGL43_26045, partial [Burkholderiales bacterium]|nr:hypothetical protein [Burkholderiales bacterium]
MSFQLPPYTRRRGGKLYLNLPIPADLRAHFLTESKKERTHIVEALRTSDLVEARELARMRAAEWTRQFRALRTGKAGELPSDLRRAYDFRESIKEAREKGDRESVWAVENIAQDHAEKIEREAGAGPAGEFYELATKPERMTLLQAVEAMTESGDLKDGTKAKRRQ